MREITDWWFENWDLTPPDSGEVTILPFSEGLLLSQKFSFERWQQGDVQFESDFPSMRERIRDEKSLQKRAVTMRGSKDMMVLMFLGALRAIGVPSRLIGSLQGIDWKGGNPKEEKSNDTQRKQSNRNGVNPSDRESNGSDEGSDDDDDDFEMIIGPSSNLTLPPKSKSKASTSKSSKAKFRSFVKRYDSSPTSRRTGAPVKLRISRPSASGTLSPKFVEEPPPILWVEVYSRTQKEWITVDVTRNKVRCRDKMEPPGNLKRIGKGGNRMSYVVAIEEGQFKLIFPVKSCNLKGISFETDGYVKDVTARYLSAYGTDIPKLRPPLTTVKLSSEVKITQDWWTDKCIKPFLRPFRLGRDEKEDQDLRIRSERAPMPNSLGGFKNHTL
jgi:xeroderma pigmentosum group C-complementing protein